MSRSPVDHGSGLSRLSLPRLVQRAHEPRWLVPLLLAASVLLVYLVTAGPIRIAGANPLAAYERYVVTPLTSTTAFAEVLLAATPLVWTGLAVAIAFRAGYWNIGAEGQFLAGAIGATVVGLGLPDLPGPVAVVLALAMGAIAGAAWALVPALLRATLRIDEVVTTLLLNPVALLLVQGLLTGPWRNSQTGFPVSDTFGSGYAMPALWPGTRVHLGFGLGLVVAVVLWLMISRTATGLRVQAVGLAPEAAAFSGIEVRSVLLRTALTSGAVAGMGGAVQVLGVGQQLTEQVAGGYGYTGIVVATLGGLTALGVVLVSLLLGDITVGAQNASLVLQLPPQMGNIIAAGLLLAVVGLFVFRRYRLTWRHPTTKFHTTMFDDTGSDQAHDTEAAS